MIYEFDVHDDPIKQDTFASPGPAVNSGIMFFTWAECPRRIVSRREEL
jgi:hypothetical protein